MTLPEEDVLLRQQTPHIVLVDVLFKEGCRLITAVLQLPRGVTGEHLHQRQSTARVAGDEGLASAAGLGQEPLPCKRKGHHAGVLMEEPAGGEREGDLALRGQRLHLDLRVLPCHRVGASLHGNRLLIREQEESFDPLQARLLQGGLDDGRGVVPGLVRQQ